MKEEFLLLAYSGLGKVQEPSPVLSPRGFDLDCGKLESIRPSVPQFDLFVEN
jgi:hypothetical protein